MRPSGRAAGLSPPPCLLGDGTRGARHRAWRCRRPLPRPPGWRRGRTRQRNGEPDGDGISTAPSRSAGATGSSSAPPRARSTNAPSPGTRTIRPPAPSAASPSPPRWPNSSKPMGPTRPTRSGISSPPTPNPPICSSRESIRAAKTVSASPPSTRSTTTMKEPGSRSLNGPYREPWCRSGSVGRHRRR